MPISGSTIQVLTQASVQQLRELSRTNPLRIYKTGFEALQMELSIETFDSPVKLIAGDLIEPTSANEAGSTDVENCIKILELLPNMTPALAADDRVWTTLALRDFAEYTRARFPLRANELEVHSGTTAGNKSLEKASNHVSNHYFADTVRRRTRDNAAGRLWWMGHYARTCDVATTREVLNALLQHDLDIASSFLGRSSIASAPSVSQAILSELVHDSNFHKYESSKRRQNFRNFMKDIDLLAGRRVLSFLSRDELQPEISELYAAHFYPSAASRVYFS